MHVLADLRPSAGRTLLLAKACHKRTSHTQGSGFMLPFRKILLPVQTFMLICSKIFVACLNDYEKRWFAVPYPFIFARLDG